MSSANYCNLNAKVIWLMLMFGKPNVYFPTSCRMVKEWCVSMLTFGN